MLGSVVWIVVLVSSEEVCLIAWILSLLLDLIMHRQFVGFHVSEVLGHLVCLSDVGIEGVIALPLELFLP